MKFLFVAAAIMVTVFGVCLLPLKVNISFDQQGLSFKGKIAVKLFGLLGPTLVFPSDSQPEGHRQKLHLFPVERPLDFVRAALPINLWLVQHIKCHHFCWKTRFSLGDAAATGIGSGLLWSLKGYLLSLFQRTVDAKECDPEILVTPVFNGETMTTEFNCIFNLRTGYIIIAGLRLLVLAIMFNLVLKGAKAA